MPLNPRTRRPVGPQTATPARGGRGAARPTGGLALPHERDESTHAVAEKPDLLMEQAKRDIDAGHVDTDMRVTPALGKHRHPEREAGAPAS